MWSKTQFIIIYESKQCVSSFAKYSSEMGIYIKFKNYYDKIGKALKGNYAVHEILIYHKWGLSG